VGKLKCIWISESGGSGAGVCVWISGGIVGFNAVGGSDLTYREVCKIGPSGKGSLTTFVMSEDA
jgi:hypothetical protein